MALRDKIAARLMPDIREALTAQQLLGVLQGMDAGTRQEVVEAFSKGLGPRAGLIIQAAVNGKATELALGRADEMLADGSLTMLELEEILG